MKFDIQERSPVVRQIDFEVPASRVDNFIDESYRDVSKQAKIKGFRPGKIPRKVLEQHPTYRNVVQEEAIKRLHEESIRHFVDSSDLHVVYFPKFEKGTLESGKPYQFKFEVEVLPNIDLSKTNELEVPLEMVSIEDTDVEEAIKAEQKRLSTLEDLAAGESSAMDDRLKVKYILQIDGGDKQERETYVWLGRGVFPSSVEQALVGQQVGKHVETSFEDEGQHVHFKFEILEIKREHLPPINDELAKDASYENLQDMKEKLRLKLEQTEREKSTQRSKDKMVELLIEKLQIPIPSNYLQSHTEQKTKRAISRLQMMSGRNFNVNPYELLHMMREEARQELQASVVVANVLKEQNFTVTPEDIEAAIEKQALQQNRNITYVRSLYGEKERTHLAEELKFQKAIEFLWSQTQHKQETLSKAERDQRVQEENAKKYAQPPKYEHGEHEHEHAEHTHDDQCGCGHDHHH